ncbi:MAG: thioredoxin domain-containing protein [Balneolaceae bacterium]|nr:thioredoxin domain-containing protein [Balneolaceae bacterium]
MPNRLAHSKSPYLLQHKDNPVEWYPWCDEAFEAAKAENKPIFLSIGYATCHWCHVMEHESFEDETIAQMMNNAFINIKVDREERPDIDATYMTVCQLINGHGGWPLSVVMNANKEPFFAATYIPKEARFGRIGMRQLIPGITGMWNNEPERIQKAITQIRKGFGQTQEFKPGHFPGTEAIDYAAEQLAQSYDDKHGGFGASPKFPSPHNLMFLLRQYHHTGDSRFLEMVSSTLKAMRLGGFWDHVGFGFHRYSTDAEWLLPHFEKMLYDQALLMMAYTEAWQLTKEPLFKQTVDEIATYVLRELTDADGGFYSAEDADSEGAEGKFYVWQVDELKEALLKEYDFVGKHFNISDEGNFEDEATKQKTGANILHLSEVLNSEDQVKWDQLRAGLFREREQRVRPLRDDKILTDWNAMMIAAFAKAGAAFKNPEYLKAAENSWGFIEQHLRENGRLMHRFRDDEADIQAFADDYLFLSWAGLELYNCTFNVEYLKQSIGLMDEAIHQCWDHEQGGFYLTKLTEDQALGLQKQIYDGAIPSSNSLGLYLLLQLGKITENQDWLNKADQLGKLFSSELIRSGSSITMGMMALQLMNHNPGEIVVAAGKDDTSDLRDYLKTEFLPSMITLWKSSDSELEELAPFTKLHTPKGEATRIYVCENYSCKAPVSNLDELIALLNRR